VTARGRRPAAQHCLVDVVGVRVVQFAAVIDREPTGARSDLRLAIGELRRPWTSVAPIPGPRSPVDGPTSDDPVAGMSPSPAN
jgi:hypothetical protein